MLNLTTGTLSDANRRYHCDNGTASDDFPIAVDSGYLAYWYGGSNYSMPSAPEWVPSLNRAVDVWLTRLNNAQRYGFILPLLVAEWDDGTQCVRVREPGERWMLETPNVRIDAEFWLIPVPSVDSASAMVDIGLARYRITYGPRGGVVVDRIN